MRINYGWIRLRVWTAIRGECSFRGGHIWNTGDRVGHSACGVCGVWRWFPRAPKAAN